MALLWIPRLSRHQSLEGGIIRLETLIEVKFLDSSFLSLSSLLELDKQLPVEPFEATVSQSTVPSPSLKNYIRQSPSASMKESGFAVDRAISRLREMQTETFQDTLLLVYAAVSVNINNKSCYLYVDCYEYYV